jgi:nucleotide-binding universal stress UspA family protein
MQGATKPCLAGQGLRQLKGNEMNIKNIVFATDFSDNSVHAFKSAKSLAEESNAKLLILFVQKDTEDTRFHYSIALLSPENTEELVEKNIEEHFSHFIEKNAGDFKNYEKIVRHGKPFVEILKFAEERSADLIVVGSHGRTGVEHVIFGSTSERLVRRAKTPVLIIPSEC